MKDHVISLLELQELEIVLAESLILHKTRAPDHGTAIDGSMDRIRERIPEDILKRYDKLRRAGLAVVHEKDGFCSGCRLHVPIGDLHRMRRGAADWVCPNCARFIMLSLAAAD